MLRPPSTQALSERRRWQSADPFSGGHIAHHHRRDLGRCRGLHGCFQERAPVVSGAVLGGCAGLPIISGTYAPAGRPSTNVSCGRLDRNVVLHLHDTASLLVGRSVQPSRNKQYGSADISFKKDAKCH